MLHRSDILHDFSISSFKSEFLTSFWVILEFFDFLEPDFDELKFVDKTKIGNPSKCVMSKQVRNYEKIIPLMLFH